MSTKGRNFGRTTAQPQDPTKVPIGIDSTTYFAPEIPLEVKEIVPLLHHLNNNEIFREVLSSVLLYLKGNEITNENFLLLQRLSNKVEGGIDISLLYTGLYTIIRLAIRQKIKNDIIKNDLLKMNLPSHYIDDIIRVIRISRFDIENTALVNRIRFPRLEKLRWRVDVIISSGSLSRVLRPTILMQMILSNKVIKTFEVSIEQFSQLRLGVAKVLFDMQTFERHPIMRIVNEFERRDREERSK